MAGLPGISVPAGLDKDGLPLGLQVTGSIGSDARTLCAALLPIAFGGFWIGMRARRAAREKSASALICMPGAITPPRNSPFLLTQSKFVPVPKSTTHTAPFTRS